MKKKLIDFLLLTTFPSVIYFSNLILFLIIVIQTYEHNTQAQIIKKIRSTQIMECIIQLTAIDPPKTVEQREALIIYLKNLPKSTLIDTPLETLKRLKLQIMSYDDLRIAEFSSSLKKQILIKELLDLKIIQTSKLSLEELEKLIAEMKQHQDQRIQRRLIKFQSYLDEKISVQEWRNRPKRNWWPSLFSIFKKSERSQYKEFQNHRVEKIGEELLRESEQFWLLKLAELKQSRPKSYNQ